MRQIIKLTESDIHNMVLEAINEFYNNPELYESKWGNRALLGTMMAGSLLGGVKMDGKFNDISMDDIRLNVPRFEREPSTYTPNVIDINGDGKLTQDEYSVSDYINKIKKDDKKQPVSRLKKDNVKHKQRDFEASSDLINYIKSYETFHDGWKDDGLGNPTTGWGFKQTPELLKKWPNGLHQTKDENGKLSCPEADAYLLHYIDSTTDEFIRKTPNVKMLPQRVKDALYDLYYNIGPTNYSDSDGLMNALEEYPKTKNMKKIINNLRYAKSNVGVIKGLQRRSTDRQDMALHGDYNREEYRTLKDLKKSRNIR